MKAFVVHRRLPDLDSFVDTTGPNMEHIRHSFSELTRLLLTNDAVIDNLLAHVSLDAPDDIDDAWYELYETLIREGRAIELSGRGFRDDYLSLIQSLLDGTHLSIDEDYLLSLDTLTEWCQAINKSWDTYRLVGMDIGTDSYVILLMRIEQFERALALARQLYKRFVLAEQL